MSLEAERDRRNVGARVPPHDLAAESSLLGAMLLSDKAIASAINVVRSSDFYRPQHGEIFEAIVDLYRAGSPADPVVVANWLNRIGALERCGGPAFLVSLQAATPAISNAGRYAELVAERSTLRNLLMAAANIADAAYGYAPPAEVIEMARNALADVAMPTGSIDAGPDLDAFLGEVDVYEWIVPGFLEKHDRIILTGGEGKGKSTLFRQIAIQVAAGIRPFTHSAIVDPARVLLIDLENSAAQVRRKLRPLRVMTPNIDPTFLTVKVRPRGIDLLSRGDQKWLTEHVSANKPDLLIIGPVYRIHDGDPTEEKPARAVSRFLDDLRDRFGFALLMEAHSPHGTTSRGKEVRTLRPFGASLWVRWPELGIGMLADEDRPSEFRLQHWRGARDERSWPTRITRGSPGEWPWIVPVGNIAPPPGDEDEPPPIYAEDDF